MSLDEKTIEAMDAFFAGKECCACGSAANRMKRGKFFCFDCLAVLVGLGNYGECAKARDPKFRNRKTNE